MASNIEGVEFHNYGDYAVCYINDLSDDLKALIKENLATICHGSHVSEYTNDPLYNYHGTIKSFIKRYDNKSEETKKGIIGEFVSHILVTCLFDDYEITSAFFNLEENSIKKGYDIILYNTVNSTVWITEVKSGSLHKNKNHDQTTKDLLSSAKNDLKNRLNEQEPRYWHNAINHVRAAVHDEKDYKDVLIKLLREEYGNKAASGNIDSEDNNVVLVSNLFESLSTKISDDPAKSVASDITTNNTFADKIVFSIQKDSYENIADYLREESGD